MTGIRVVVEPPDYHDEYQRAHEAADLMCALVQFVTRLQALGLAHWVREVNMVGGKAWCETVSLAPRYVAGLIHKLLHDFCDEALTDAEDPPSIEARRRQRRA